MPNLSKSTIRKMRAVVKAVLAEPEFYDQNRFPVSDDCGSTCCAAGWAVWLKSPEKYGDIAEELGGFADWRGLAKKALGLRVADDQLFGFASSWPTEYSEMYYAAATPLERAQAMAARWEHFIATDGEE